MTASALVEGIAFQINILALNAAVEAAGAGGDEVAPPRSRGLPDEAAA
jgi:hypothetical protein